MVSTITILQFHVLTCHRYKPALGINYAAYIDGSMNITTLDLGGKSFEEAVGTEVNYKNTKDLIATEAYHGQLDLNNWGRSPGSAELNNGHDAFDCSSGEVVAHFAMTPLGEGSVTVDQVSKAGKINGVVQRAGWYLKYE
jgi:hypothetical protein